MLAQRVNASRSGGDIWVKTGTFNEPITLKAGAYVYGGFAGTELTRDARNWTLNTTVIDGCSATYAVTASSGGKMCVVDGFTIRNGSSARIYCSESSPSISNNIIAGNGTSKNGMGIYCNDSSPVILHNTITGNTVGIYCHISSPIISANMITGNSTDGTGGGIYCYISPATISNNWVTLNSANGGGGIYCEKSSATISNNTLVGNNAVYGGGLYIYSSLAQISNNLVAYNSSGIYAFPGQSYEGQQLPTLRNNDVHNTDGYNYSGISAGVGDTSADPKLTGALRRNLHIQPDSPCRDAGWNGAAGIGSLDIDGQSRIQNGIVDIGADESDGTLWHVPAPVIVRVDGAGGTDTNDGSDWSLAKKTVQGGIDAASASGGEVWVKAGIYNERITLKSYACVYGGFNGTESSRDARNWGINRTVLDGGAAGSVVTAAAGFGTSAIDGFVVQHGSNSGIYCDNSSPTISHNTVVGNTSVSGGGVYLHNCLSLISNNTITGNTSSRGGGIYSGDSSPTISNNVISANNTGDYGGGIYCDNSLVTVSNNLIRGNGCGSRGGGIFCQTTVATICNNTIVANSNGTFVANNGGGGMYFDGSSVELSNNIITHNTSGIYIRSYSSPTIRNNCIYNPDGANYSGVSAGTGDISVDPKFTNFLYGDYHIQPDSPCRDAGWNGAASIGGTDVDGQARIQNGTVDIGADESDGTLWPAPAPVIVRVDGVNGSDTNGGSDWSLAKKTVQSAIDAASASGGEVWVKAGIYNERITLKSYAYVYGGFVGTESSRDARDWAINKTVLDGGAAGSVVTSTMGWRVLAIDGFTIRNGKAANGAGIYCSASAPTVANNTISRNNALNYGGGVYCASSSATISGNVISQNVAATSGGGIYAKGYPSCLVTNNTIAGNGSQSYGGSIYADSSKPMVFNSIIAFNSSGIYASSATLANNNIYNPEGPNYSGVSAGTGDISVDPKFTNFLYGDYHIQPDSPCRDAGWNGAAGIGGTDIDGQARIQNGTVDIGADESDGTPWPVAAPVIVRVDGTNGSDSNDGSDWSLAKRTVQAGIDVASASGGEVWVKAGIYNERITLKSYAYVYGGFNGTESSRDARNWSINKTILDGGAAGSVVTSLMGWRALAIDGFTIRNGKAANGAGIYCALSAPGIANNIITSNTAGGNGGGVYCQSASPAILGNTINKNTANYGSGIYINAYSALMVNNTIAENKAGSNGGVYLGSSKAQLSNNIVAYNSSGIYGSGNAATLRNNDVFNPDGTNYYGISAGTGDISVDPKFVSSLGGNYHIQPDSPCRDAGWNEAPGIGNTDIDAQSRILPADGVVDIGADESDGTLWDDTLPLIVRVDGTNGNDANDGSTWASAKKTVQAAIDVASAWAGEVWVKAGTYNELVTLKNNALVYGGFVGTESTRRARNWLTNPTVLDGGKLGSVVTATGISWGRGTIDGFTIRNGKAPNGGGISCTSSALAISNNTIAGNSATSSGGGIYCSGTYSAGSSPTISNNSIWGNTSRDGGGIYCWSSAGTTSISNNSIYSNTVTASGGGVYAAPGQSPNTSLFVLSNNAVSSNNAVTGAGIYFGAWTNAAVSNNVIVKNKSNTGGGGLYCSSCSPTVSNNTFAGNTSYTGGGGVHLSSSPSTKMSSNVIAFNSSGINNSSGTPTLRNNDLYNPGGYNYQGLSAGTGDISKDPLFVNLSGGDYHLTPSSPCINAGWNQAPGLLSMDVDGEPRILAGTVDIGADEATCVARVWGPKALPDDTHVEIASAIVTAAFTDVFYVESDDRVCGIRVSKPGHGLLAGMRAHVAGLAKTDQSAERYIQADSVVQNGTGTLRPLALPNRAVGGGQFGLQSPPWGWTLVRQPDNTLVRVWSPGTGLSNIGLLIKTWGRVTYSDASCFYADDGSGLDDNFGHKGIKVYGRVPVPPEIDPIGKMVEITGISSCERLSADPVRIIRTRGVGNVLVLE